MARSTAQWNSLSTAQRNRYIAAGRTGRLTGEPFLDPSEVRAYYIRGGDLGGGRGYHPPQQSAPEAPTKASSIGVATPDEVKRLGSWRKNSAPAWLPKSQSVMGDDTAALLSQIGLQPKNWQSVTITPAPGGRFIMRVKSRRSERVASVLLPDRSSVVEVRNLLNTQSRIAGAPNARERARLEKYWRNAAGQPFAMEVDIVGTDTPNSNYVGAIPTQKKGQALPRNRKTK